MELEKKAKGGEDDDDSDVPELVGNFDDAAKTKNVAVKNPVDLVVSRSSQFYDEASPALEKQFKVKNDDYTQVVSIAVGNNSYGTAACKWIADTVLAKCVNLKKLDLSDMFTKRLKSDIPGSVKLMMDAIMDK